MRPYEIHSATITWRNCVDMRPWLIVDVRPGDVYGCFPIATQCYGSGAFYLDAAGPDFAATGLAHACYIHYDSIIDLQRARFGRYRGFLGGPTLVEFLRAAGLS